jgi:hypothetical protein
MNLFKYDQFLGTPINENLDKAKKFLKDRYILTTTAKELGYLKGEIAAQLKEGSKRSLALNDFTHEQQAELRKKYREVKLTDDQIRNIERDPEFVKIRELLKDNPGFIFAFTYFYYVEMVNFTELESMYKKLIQFKDLLNRLPKKFDANFIDPNIKNNAEVLVDGLDSLEDYKRVKKIVDRLTPELKKDYLASPSVIKDQFVEVARAFDELGKKPDGTVDEENKERLQKAFFGEVRTIGTEKRYVGQLKRYKNIREFIKAAQNHLKASQNSDIIAFYDRIDKCNEKFGNLGADICFDENGILIIEVKSFQANQMLNGNTRHCIKDYLSQWENYVSSHNNKQYYIYNFNLPQYDNNSVNGITIAPGTGAKKIRACHAKDDSGTSSSIQSTLKGWEKKYGIETNLFDTILQPMTKEEVEKREKAKLANREIIKKGLTIEQILKYVKEDGADINKDQGIALENAVSEDNLEKVKAILGLGASPNLKTGPDAVISKAKNLDMIKLLVDNGSELTGEVFNGIANDISAVQYCLDAGLDPNFSNSLPIRVACRGSWTDRNHPGEGYTEIFKLLVKHGARFCDDRGRFMAVKWAAEYGRLDLIDYMIGLDVKTGFDSAATWLGHSRKIPDSMKKEVTAYLSDKSKKYETEESKEKEKK